MRAAARATIKSVREDERKGVDETSGVSRGTQEMVIEIASSLCSS